MSSGLEFRDALVKLDLCSNCGACMAFKTAKYCPQIGIPEELYQIEPLPKARSVYVTRARDDNIRSAAQDGGTVTALCKYLLEKGVVKYVLGCKFGKGNVVAVPEIVTDPSRVLVLSKSKYTYVPVLSLLSRVRKEELDKVCVVGVPCQIRSLNMIERDLGIKFVKICILCSSNFKREFLLDILKKHGKKVEDVAKMEIKKKFRILFNDGTVEEVPIKEAKKYSGKCCEQCPELVSHYADLAVGSMFLPEGWNFVLVLTDIGENIVRSAIDANVLEVGDVPQDLLEKIEKVARQKQEQARKTREEVKCKLRELGLLK